MNLLIRGHCSLPSVESTLQQRNYRYAFRNKHGRCKHTAARQKAVQIRCQGAMGSEALGEAKDLFERGDRVRALRLYEQALKQELNQKDRREALYGATAVHASFGDIEQAQMTLREGLDQGLDFEAALSDSRLPKWKSGPQVLVQLKKFARTVKSIREAVKPAIGKQKAGSLLSEDGSERKLNPNMDLSEMLRTDISGLDATVTGIVKRVALLIFVGIGLGAILFYVGLELSGIGR